jgi:hypothetical protein
MVNTRSASLVLMVAAVCFRVSEARAAGEGDVGEQPVKPAAVTRTPSIAPTPVKSPPPVQVSGAPQRVVDEKAHAEPNASGLPTSTSYGGQIVVADMAGLLGAYLVGQQKNDWHFWVVPYPLASPLVHTLHGNPGSAALSLLLHVGAPLAGAFLGAELGKGSCSGDSEDVCGIGETLVGIGIGLVSATVIDATVLARDRTGGGGTSHALLSPTFSVAPSGRTTIGVAAMF